MELHHGKLHMSSLPVANGVVYVGSYDNKVYALNAATGAHGMELHYGRNCSIKPTVANGVVYVGSYDGEGLCEMESSPPVTQASITNLHNTTYLQASITWNWTIPG